MRNLIFNPGVRSVNSSLAALIIRLAFGALMLTHGVPKLVNFADYAPNFMNFMGLSGGMSLGLVVFAELFCSILLILGIGTRLAVIPLLITMLVAVFVAHANDPFSKKEMGLLYFFAYFSLLISGAGKYSIDAMIKK